MTPAKRRWLLALVEGRVCSTCRNGTIDCCIMWWFRVECEACHARRVEAERHEVAGLLGAPMDVHEDIAQDYDPWNVQ